MTDIKEITKYLNNYCTSTLSSGCANGTGLTAVHKRIFNHKKNLPKAEVVKDLSAFYAFRKNIIDIWDALSKCERDFVSYLVQYEGKEYLHTTIEYANMHHLALEQNDRWGRTKSLMGGYGFYEFSHLKFLNLLTWNIPDTKAVLLFPSGKDMPFFVLEALKTVVEPMKFAYSAYTPAKSDVMICREDRIGDFAAFVQFAASERLKVKAGTFDLTKAKLAKLSEVIGFEEVCDKDGKFCNPKEAKRNNDFKVAPLVFALAANSGLLDIDSAGNVTPGKKSPNLLFLPPNELVKKLYDNYCDDNEIYELHYITYISAYDGDHWIPWPECRQPILDLLKKCPIEEFINFKDFDQYAKLSCGNFFRRLLNCALMVKGYDFGYGHYGSYEPDWEECEAQIIRLILSFLSAMGMVDIAYTEDVPRIKYAGDDFCVGIAGFRITKLGSWVLGMTDAYEAAETGRARNDKGGLLVLPDYSVVISGIKCRIEHETFLSQFLTNVSFDENAAIYRLDVQSVIRAYNQGIKPKKIKTVLSKASDKPLPENVARFLDDWQAKDGRVRIRTLTVIETDDAFLLEEVKHVKGIGDAIVCDLPHAVAINKDQQKKAKALIEKNGWLVKV